MSDKPFTTATAAAHRRGKSRFTERELRRAVRAVEKAGREVGEVEITKDGSMIVRPLREGQSVEAGRSLDDWLAEHAHED